MGTFTRVRDSQRYTWDGITRVWPGHTRLGDCVYLIPVCEGRSHYKSLARFLLEYTSKDGSSIKLEWECV